MSLTDERKMRLMQEVAQPLTHLDDIGVSVVMELIQGR